MGRYGSLILVTLCLLFDTSRCWEWFGSSSSSEAGRNSFPGGDDGGGVGDGGSMVAEFSMTNPSNNKRGLERVENAKKKLATAANSCWVKAYQALFAGCAEIINNEEKRQRLAWHLSDCFQKDSGGSPFPACTTPSPIGDCLKTLKEDARRTYLEFYLEANSICHELQAHAFRQQTERLVNGLRRSSEFAEEKLEIIEEKAENLVLSSKEIHDSLTSIDIRTRQVAEASKNVEDHIEQVLHHSQAVFEQSKGIASSQSELRDGQNRMKEKLEEGMAALDDSYNSLGREIDILRSEAVEIEKEISRVGTVMSSKMENLQTKADDIGLIAGISLDKQKELLDAQSTALEGLRFLTKFQSQALQESRDTLQQLTEFGHKQQEELLMRQGQLQQAHDHLVENSKSILAAQEAFESKQATMFVALEKLFTLHNAMLVESRLIKAFFVYSISIFILYMFTSTKQTYNVRPRLYIGLTVTFLIECSLLRLEGDVIEQRKWIISTIRFIYVLGASLQLLYAIFTYRDYEVMNHKMLLSLMDKVNGMPGRNKEAESWESDCDDDVNWSSWIDSDLAEDVDSLKDPDFVLPDRVGDNFLPNTTAITRIYDLRRR